jgi:hypothetical protein
MEFSFWFFVTIYLCGVITGIFISPKKAIYQVRKFLNKQKGDYGQINSTANIDGKTKQKKKRRLKLFKKRNSTN